MKLTIPTRHGHRVAACLIGFALLFHGLQAAAQEDPPGRVARLSFHQGTVSFSPAGDDSWYDAVPNRPLTTGDRLWTDRNARAEIHVGSAALRLDDQTSITLSELDDETARITVQQGSLQARVRDNAADQRFEINTDNLAVVVDAPGDYRVDTDPAGGTTRVAIAAGNATLYGERGESVPLGSRQQLTVSGRNLAAVSGSPAMASPGFDAWAAERDRAEERSVSARYVSRDVVGYQQLDAYGDWQNDASYGNVWYPRDVDADWAPYRDGQWVDVAPWGWTWVDAAPWGFAPSHYGRWARIGPRWGWVPGRPAARSVYAPALVGFVGGAGGVDASLAIGGGRNGVGWFPLAPGEAWRPGYRASQAYIEQANRAGLYGRSQPARGVEFAHQRTPGAVTVVPVDVFGRGPISRRDVVRFSDDRVTQARVGTGVPMPFGAERGWGGIGRPAAGLPPRQFQARPQDRDFRQFQPVQQVQQGQQGQPRDFSRRQQDGSRQQQPFDPRAAQVQQMQQAQQYEQLQQRDSRRQQQDFQQRANQEQGQRQMQQQQLQLQQQQQMQQQQGFRQQQELQQQRAVQAQQLQMQQQQAQRAQQQQQMQMQMQQQLQQQQQQQQQQQLMQQQQMQQRAAQGNPMQQPQRAQGNPAQQQQNDAMRQAQDAQQRAAQQRQQQMQRAFGQPGSGDRP